MPGAVRWALATDGRRSATASIAVWIRMVSSEARYGAAILQVVFAVRNASHAASRRAGLAVPLRHMTYGRSTPKTAGDRDDLVSSGPASGCHRRRNFGPSSEDQIHACGRAGRNCSGPALFALHGDGGI